MACNSSVLLMLLCVTVSCSSPMLDVGSTLLSVRFHLSFSSFPHPAMVLRGGGRPKADPAQTKGGDAPQAVQGSRSVRSSTQDSAALGMDRAEDEEWDSATAAMQEELQRDKAEDVGLEAEHSSQLLRGLEEKDLSELKTWTDQLHQSQAAGIQASKDNTRRDFSDGLDGDGAGGDAAALEEDSSLQSGADAGVPLLDRLARGAVLNQSLVS